MDPEQAYQVQIPPSEVAFQEFQVFEQHYRESQNPNEEEEEEEEEEQDLPPPPPPPQPRTQVPRHRQREQQEDRNDWVRTDDEAIDLLVWWRQNARRFPVLSSMAQDILTIHVSTVSSEAAFSSAGRIIDDRRCSLKPDMVEALTCGKDWIQHRNPAQETFMCFDILDDFEVDFANVNINA